MDSSASSSYQTSSSIPEPDMDKHVDFVCSMLISRMNGAHYQQLRSLFLGILSQKALLDTTYQSSPPKYTEQSKSLTLSEVKKFHHTLDELHEHYPEVDVTVNTSNITGTDLAS